MAKIAQLIPNDPTAKESVVAVLREHPELQDFIARVTDKAEEVFPEFDIVLDTVQYDEWDPPVRMLVHITQPWDDFWDSSATFAHWVGRLPEYDWELILVMPMWNGPIESYRQGGVVYSRDREYTENKETVFPWPQSPN